MHIKAETHRHSQAEKIQHIFPLKKCVGHT